MMLSYMLQFLDKQSLSQAAIMGIIEDLVSPMAEEKTIGTD